MAYAPEKLPSCRYRVLDTIRTLKVFQPLPPDTDLPLHDQRAKAAREVPNSHADDAVFLFFLIS